MLAAILVLMQLGTNVTYSWIPQPVGTTADLHVVRALSPSDAWAVGKSGTSLHTADGGVSWHPSNLLSCAACPLNGLVAQDATSGVVISGGPARIYVTGDGGLTWTLRWASEEEKLALRGLAFFDAHRGFAVSDPQDGRFHLLRTTDGGATWAEAPRGTLPAPGDRERVSDVSGSAVTAVGANLALIGVSGGRFARVLRTTDGGESWKSVPTQLAEINAIAFLDGTTGIAAGTGRGRGNVVRTSDGGLTWSEPVVSATSGTVRGATFIPGASAPTAVAVGPNGSAMSTDAGRTWRLMDRIPANAVSFSGVVDAGWKVGDGGEVRKLMRGVTPTRLAGEPTPSVVKVPPPALGRVAPSKQPPPGATPTPLGSRPLHPTPTPKG